MSDENRTPDAERVEQRRKHEERFLVHEADGSRPVERIGSAMSPSAVHQTAAARSTAQRRRKVPPKTDRTQALMKKHQCWSTAGARPNPLVLQPMARHLNERHSGRSAVQLDGTASACRSASPRHQDLAVGLRDQIEPRLRYLVRDFPRRGQRITRTDG